jgi:hypothetical protein
MIIITMAPSDTPTTSTTCSSSHDTKATEHQRVPPVLYSNSSTNENSNSVSVSVSGALSNISSSNITKRKRRVSFSFQQNAYFTPEQQLTTEERKNECWYSEVELNASRNDARMAIQALHHQLQMDAAAAAAGTYSSTTRSEGEEESSSSSSSSSDYGSDDTSATSSFDGSSTNSNNNNNNNSSWVLRCPQDKTKIVCLRGIEKYADAAAKYTGQKRLVRSVLQQQSLNNKDVHISLVSRTLSEPFKEVARYYAVKSADELDLSRKLEEEEQREMERKQREEVASVLLLIMGMGQQQQQQNDVPTSPSSTNLKMPLSFSSPIVTPRGGSTSTIPSLKRNSPTNCPSLSKRNVKRCIR